jgi:hypothetical protein
MKKLVLVGLIVVVAVLALGTAGYAYAQSQQLNSGTYGPGMMGGGWGGPGGRGMHGGGFGMMGYFDEDGDGYGPMHNYMLQGFAEAFGLTVEELQAKLDAGETMYSIAEAQGMTLEEFRTLMIDVRTEVFAQMVADGVITQAQADWMLARMAQMWQNGYGPGSGSCPMGGGRGGRWNQTPEEQP